VTDGQTDAQTDRYRVTVYTSLAQRRAVKQRHIRFRRTLCLQNDTDVSHYNFNPHKPILVIFGKDVAERVANDDLLFCLS